MRLSLKRMVGDEIMLVMRFIRKLPALYRQERCSAQNNADSWCPNRIVIAGENDEFFAIYSPDDLQTPCGEYLRTYNIFCHQANAWYMRREISNFIRYAKPAIRFADVGSAEGFYSALFASMHGTDAEILSIDCGSRAGCNPAHTLIVIDQNRQIFSPRRWDYIKAFVTDARLGHAPFELPDDCQYVTLSQLFEDARFIPDLIKLDIESSEHDVLLDSVEWLARHKPTLIIEIHNAFLARQGLDFQNVIDQLATVGYRVIDWDDPNYLNAGNCHIVMQASSQ